MNRLFDEPMPPCPHCQQTTALPIVYGDASTEMVTAARLGQIVLGGVATEGDMPAWMCPCGTRYED